MADDLPGWLPVDYNPFANPSDTLAAGATAISGNDPTLGALTTGANIQQQRFGGPTTTALEGLSVTQC